MNKLFSFIKLNLARIFLAFTVVGFVCAIPGGLVLIQEQSLAGVFTTMIWLVVFWNLIPYANKRLEELE